MAAAGRDADPAYDDLWHSVAGAAAVGANNELRAADPAAAAPPDALQVMMHAARAQAEGHAPAPAPAKRGRGRPRKSPAPAPAAAAPDGAGQPVGQPAPHRRGRPRKAAPAPQAQAGNAPAAPAQHGAPAAAPPLAVALPSDVPDDWQADPSVVAAAQAAVNAALRGRKTKFGGDNHYPELSVTITSSGSDMPWRIPAAPAVHVPAGSQRAAGLLGLERGEMQHHLHWQGAARRCRAALLQHQGEHHRAVRRSQATAWTAPSCTTHQRRTPHALQTFKTVLHALQQVPGDQRDGAPTDGATHAHWHDRLLSQRQAPALVRAH